MLSSRLGDARRLTRRGASIIPSRWQASDTQDVCQRCVTRRPCRRCDRYHASARVITSAARP
eukprot:4306826-Prymnesium_polylepis.1